MIKRVHLTVVPVGIALCLVWVGATRLASEGAKKDPFSGSWKMNPAKSTMFVGEQNQFEITTFTIQNDVQQYHVWSEGPKKGGHPEHHAAYTSKYNEAKWVPYADLATGKATSLVMTVKVDDRTHYRLARTPEGKAQYVLMRRLADDGQSYAATLMNTDGKITLIRVFDKCAEPCKP
jgi:hypothetical protein